MLDTLSGCCSGLKSSFLIFSLNSGEEIHYIIADNHVGHSVEKKNSWGEHTSMGSTSWAITTSCAFLLSTSVVTVFTPEKQQECQLKKIKSSTGSQLGGFNQILQGPNDLKHYSLKGKTTTHTKKMTKGTFQLRWEGLWTMSWTKGGLGVKMAKNYWLR